MGPSVEQQLVQELENALAQQQAAVSDGHASIRDTIREMQQALQQLESRESALSETTTKLGAETADRLKAFHDALSKSTDAEQSTSKELDAATKKLEAAKARIAELEENAGNVPALKEQIASLEEKSTTLQAEVDRQAELLIEADKAHKRLRKLEQAYKDQSAALQAGEAARRHAAELETTVEEYKQATHAEQQRVAELQQALDEARTHGAELSKRVAELESQDTQRAAKELEETKSLLDEAAEQIIKLQEEFTSARTEAERLEKNLAELDEEVSSRSVELGELREVAEALESDKKTLTTELEELRSRARETAESERKLGKQLESLTSEFEIARETAQRVEELERERKALAEDNTALKRKATKLEDELQHERAKGTKSQLAAQLSEALEEREFAEATIRSLREQLESQVSAGHTPLELETPAQTDDEEEVFVPDDAALVDAKRLLGDILLEANVVSSDQLEAALSAQQAGNSTRRLGEVLVAMGYTHEVEVAQALARQRGLKFIALETKSIDREAAHLISGRLAEMHMCIPVREKNGELVLAMENPLDLIAIEDVERASERRVRPAVATISAIQAAISAVYAHERQRA